ncbi:recombinase family protein [Candidatus Pacearchaeota archaeon]|nr:recombinase family protein [Candidatus Pacearchaeota archaeon]
MHAIGYIRLSDEDRNKKDKTELETSLINQRKDVEGYIKNNQHEFIEIYDDKYLTGDDPDRPELKRMIDDMYSKKFDLIVIKNLSRLTRNPYMQKELLMEFQLNNIQVVSLEGGLENEVISETTAFVNHLLIVLGRMNARKLHERKQSENLPYITAPFGYKFDDKKEWVVDKKKADIIKKIFELTLQGVSYLQILKETKISKSLYYKIIKNKSYIGFIVHKKYIKNPIGRIIKINKVEYLGRHEAIIQKEIFDRTQEFLKNKKLYKK